MRFKHVRKETSTFVLVRCRSFASNMATAAPNKKITIDIDNIIERLLAVSKITFFPNVNLVPFLV